MAIHVSGQASCANSQAPTLHLGAYRRAIMAVMSADVFTPAERLRANDSVYQTEDATRLVLWLKNVRRVADERQQVIEQADLAEVSELVATAPVRYATAEQTSEIHRLALHQEISLGERTKVLLVLPRLKSYEAKILIGELWAKILHRTGGGASGSPDLDFSFSSAA